MKFIPKNVLVTGGAGFIGCNFIRYLLAHDSQVKIINLDALTYAGTRDNLLDIDPQRHQLIVGNICDADLVNRILRDYQIDTVVHFAAESHVDRSILGPKVFVETNVLGTFNLLECARNFWQEMGWEQAQCRWHHISTDEVYGTLTRDEPAFTEVHPFKPNSPYSASKAGSDHLVRAYFHTYNLPITISNCSNNYGPYQHAEKFIPTIIRACLQNEAIPVYGDGSNIRDWLYVDDHCAAIDCILRNGAVGETYNVGGNNEWSNLAIAETIRELLNSKSEIIFVKDRPGHDWRYAIDARKIATQLNWRPRETFASGIRKTCDFVCNLPVYQELS